MAEENDGGEVSLEGNLLTNRIQDLVSSSDPSQTDNKTHAEALEFISSILTERENEVLDSEDADELFYSILIAVTAHRIGTWIDLCSSFTDLTLKVAGVILSYCLSRIHSTKSHAFFSKGTLVKMVEGICLGKGCLEKDELTQISEVFDSLKIPDSLKILETEKTPVTFGIVQSSQAFPFQILQQSQQSLNQGTDWQDAYKVHCAQTVRNLDGGSTLLEYAFCLPTLTLFHCYFDEWGSSSHSSDINHINIRRLETLSEELVLVNSIVTMPSVVAVKQDQLQRLCSLVCKCLKAAFFVAIGRYEVTVDDDSKWGAKIESSLEDSCRKFAWKATETSLAVFKSVLTVISGSTRFGGGVCQNLQAIVVDTILNGFTLLLGEKKARSDEAESKVISAKWKWFSGLNIMLVTMASRIATLMLALIEDLELEDVPQITSSDESAHAISYLLVSTQCSAWQRMQWLFARNNLPQQMWKLFCSAYSMATTIKSMKKTQAVEKEDETSNESTESARTSGGDDSGEEEGSVFGQWLENILQESTTGRHEAKKDKADDARSEVAYTQSLDIFVLLGNNILDLCTKLFPLCMKYNFDEIVSGMFSRDGIKSLASMINEVDSSADELSVKEDIKFYFRSYLVMLYSFKVLDQDKLELLLAELGVANDEESSEWPLYVSCTVLTLFGRLALTEQQVWLRKGNASADTPRAINAWKRLLKKLEKANDGGDKMNTEKDLNVEHLQLLASLFVNFSRECKMQLMRQCLDAITNISANLSDGYPLRAYRLVIILDFMFRAFSEVPYKLFEQLSRNVLNVALKAEDGRQIDFIGSSFKAEDSFLSLVKRAKSNILQSALLQQQPRFYELISDDFNKLPSDFEVFSAIASDIASDSYKGLYSAFLRLCSSLLNFMDKNHALEERVLQVVAARSCFQHIWKFLVYLPPPVLLLNEITAPDKVMESTELTLLFLRVMPTVFVNLKIETSLLAKKLYTFDKLVTEDVLELVERLRNECAKTQYITDIATNLSIEESDSESCGKTDWTRMLLVDALSCLLRVLFESIISVGQEDDEERERMAKLSWILLNNIISCHKRIKYAVITHRGEIPNKDVLEVYSKMIGITASHNVKDAAEINFSKGLPEDIKEASEKWKDILLTQFPSPKRILNESSEEEIVDLTTYIDGLLTAHVTVFVTGISFEKPASTLKHLLKSSIDFMHTILKWLQSNSEEQFHMIQINAITAFVNLVTNSIVDHVSDAANQILEITIGSSDSERLQEILHSHLLSLCFFVVDEEINRVDSFLTSEETVLQCLGFIEKSLQRPDAPCSAADYFSSGYSFKLASILLSIRLSKFSKYYARKVLQIFSCLLSSSETGQQNSVHKAIVEIFNIDSSDLQEWLRCEVMSDSGDRNEVATTHQAIPALQKFVNCAMQEKEVDKEYILETAITLFERLIKARMLSPSEAENIPFADFFEVLVNISSTVGARGHLKLLQSVKNWISQSRESLAVNFSKVKEDSACVDEDLMRCTTVLLRYLDQVLTCMRKFFPKESSSLTLQLSYSESDYASRDRPEAEADDDINTDDEDSGGEESEEDSICNKLCTFTTTQRDFMNQHWYHCHTCKMNDNVGCCTICAKVCHKDHDVTYAKYGSFFCDCGAKEDGSCKSMTKRSPITGYPGSGSAPPSPFTAWTPGTEGSESKQRNAASSEVKPELKRGKSLEKKHSLETWRQDSHFIHLFGNLLKESKEEVFDKLKDKTLLEDYMKLLQDIYSYKEYVENHLKVNNAALQTVHQALDSLYHKEKDIQASDQLMIPILGSQEGAFESVRLNFSGEQGQTLRQLINAHVLRHSAMCLMASANGKRQHLAVTHEKGKITILQLAGLLKQPDTSSRKLTLSRLSSTTLPFTIVSIQSNLENEDALAVCGLKDCHVITYGHAGSVVSHVALPLQLETGNFVIKAVWVPGEQTKIALLTADFVKVYDLSKSVTSPQYHYMLPGGKVRDATFVNDGTAIHIAVMSSHGHIYTEVMNETTCAESDAFFLTNAVMVTHPALTDSNGHIAGGGVSLYYSHVLKLMFFSYSQGKSFVGVLGNNLSEMDKVFNLSPVIASHAPLCHWHEITGQPGLLHCINQTSGNPVLVMVTPDKISIQELKGAPLKSKIQDAVCYYHTFPITRNTDTTIQQKTTMIVLLEDGSLRIYNAHKDTVSYWLQRKFRPKAFPQLHPSPKKTKATRAVAQSMPSNVTSFPIDFFEHCQPSNDIEFGGSDVLHVYNRQQVKHRLNTAGMYIASTKASGFKVEITNTNTSNVMVGLRVQLGMRSLEKTPTYVEIFGRMIPLRLSRNRWFDMPFTKTESLTADKKITVTFGPSSDSSGINMIDSIKVYCKTKESFGWPEDAQESTGQPVDVHHPTAAVVASGELNESTDASKSEPLLIELLETLNDHLLCFPIDEDSKIRKQLLDFTTNLMTRSGSTKIQSQARTLMASLFASKNDFFDWKDESQIKHALQQYKATGSAPSTESVQELLSVARTVGNVRPKNLIKALKDFDMEGDFLDDVMASFWKLYAMRPVNYVIAAIEARAVGNLDGSIEALVEVLFAVLLGDSEQFTKLMEIIVKLLLSKDSKISFAVKQGLSQAMQIRRKVSIVTDASPTQSESPGIEDLNQDKALKDEGAETAETEEQPTVDSDVQEINSFAEGVIEDLEPQQDGLQAFLGGDDAVMELALALSLQDQDNENFDDDDDDDVDDEDDEDDGDDVDLEDDTDAPLPSQRFDSLVQENQPLIVNAGASGSNANEILEDAAITDDIIGRERKSSRDSERSCPALPKKKKIVEIIDTALEASWSKIFNFFIDHLQDLKSVDGIQAIPYLQVLLMLCSSLSDSEKDQQDLERVVTACLEILELDVKNFDNIADRDSKKEVQLVIIRFFSVLLSQSRSVKELKTDEEATRNVPKPGKVVAKILAEKGIVKYCLEFLESLLPYWREVKTTSNADSTEDDEVLLKPKPTQNPPDMSPFFLKQYVKSHASDLFEAFPQLVTEMILRMPYQIRKRLDSSSDLESDVFGSQWIFCLCEYMMATETPFIKRHVRKLLLVLCGSKEKYRHVKDLHALKAHVRVIRSILQPGGNLSEAQTNLSYEETVRLADNCKACADIAMARVDNWQMFCKQEKGVLPFLVQASYRLSSEHVSGIFLQLIGLALGSTSTKSSGAKGDDKAEKGLSKDNLTELVGLLFDKCYSSLLFIFIKSFLLESNSTSLRWKAHELLHTIFRNIPSEQRVQLVELMWQLWSYVPFSGHKAAQFVDLLGYFTVKSPEVKDKMENYTGTVFSLLEFSNKLLMNHPNASIYRRLQSLVEVNGFYLENDPCIVCNNPEIPFTHAKLTSIKSDIRYTTTAQLVKLNVNYTISRLLLRISDIKRAKMVKTINIYYNNKPVPSVVELKNKRNIWQKAKRITLTTDQTDVKVDFTLPIVAYNLMIEYADFYDNIQLSAESLQCPRCSASVPANPGVCANCGENVYQCHKCRAINYDERDPFLCTSCGFCKYAKFEYTLVTRPCYAVEPVNDETERQAALNSVNNLLDSADKIYQQLSNHKQSLESSLRGISEEASTSKAGGTGSSSSGSSASNVVQVNKNIQTIAQKYCIDCKTSFEELSKIIQKVTATRKELSGYDQRQQEILSTIVATSPGASPIPKGDSPFPDSSQSLQRSSKENLEANTMGKCYGCALFTVEHCLTILRAFATIKESHNWMLNQGLLHELLEHSLQHKKIQVTSLARKLIILITTGNIKATHELNEMIMKQVALSLESKAANVISDIFLQSQMSVLGLSLNTLDEYWNDRLRCVFSLFLDSMQKSTTDVLENVTLPCLKILANSIQKASAALDEKGDKEHQVALPGVNAVNWLEGGSRYTLKYWRSKNPTPTREESIAEKYAGIWLRKVETSRKQRKPRDLSNQDWLRLLLFAPSSRAVRETVCGVLENLCKMESKKEKMLQIFTSYLDHLHDAGENANDFFNLFKLLIKPPEWKRHLVACGILEKVTGLIVKEVDYLNSLENKTVGFDLSQGFALHALADILKMLFEDEVVKANNKSTFVGHVLQCYLSLRRLVVQRTKLIDAAQDILLALLEELTTGTEAEERAFMAVCISALKEYPISDIRTPVFIYERLCNIIHKEEKEVNEFFVIIEKDPQQEDFLQGRMSGNPYSSKEPGLGPLMRDIKNKICTECELVALLEDDTGMELLVNNKIISLDLPVADVYKKIWCAKGERPEAMKIVYRMRGLLGDATEDMVDNLDSDKDKDIDEEYEYRQAAVISEVGGLDIILKRLSYVRDLSRAQELISVMLKLLEYCVKVKVNRQYLGKHSVNSLKIMLGTLNLALRLEKEKGSGSGGAMTAERLLKIMGIVLHEASEQADQYQLSSFPGEESQLELLLGHITSPYVRANPNVLEAMMRLIPSLSFGSEQSMRTLINHFIPYLNFNRFDEERSANETLYLECFCVIANGISNTTSGSRLKDLILDHGIPQRALQYLNQHTPPKSFSASGILDANRWKEVLVKPALPYVLRILTGLVGGHEATQNLVGTEENIAMHHRLEQVSSEESVGSLAENLIEALRENPEVAKKVQAVRRQTREDKKKMALAMRQKQLEALGMVVTEGGQIKAKPSSVIKEMEELLEEKGLICCICREGYKFHPKKVLGVYTYTTRCVLEEFENKPRKNQGYSTVSHFNVIHVDCHNEAIRHARSRDEWESAALQNANTKCNGLLPIWGPKVSESAFATCLARHNNYLQECTGFHEPTFHSTVHDMKLLLLRFAQEKSFSDEAGGGGRISNIYLFPYTAHVALYVLNTARLHVTEDKIITTFLEATVDKWIESAYEVDGPHFVTVLSLFTMSLENWNEKRLLFLRRLIVVAHARSLSATPLKKWPEDNAPKQFSIYKPMLIFYELTNQFHLMFKAKLSASATDWASAMSTYIRNNDEAIIKAADKLLSFYENELLPCESFEEFFDVAGLLSEVEDPSNFLKETLDMVQ